MKFKYQIKRGSGTLNRGERCLFRSTEAVYMGSFRENDDSPWNHMLLVRQIMAGEVVIIEEFIVTTTETKDILFKAMMPEQLEGQMLLC